MKLSDILHTCSQNLIRRKSRTFLTVLGVIVGCCSIVLMISFGQGTQEQDQRMLAQLGDLNNITVSTSSGDSIIGSSSDSSTSSKLKLNDDAVKSFKKIEGVQGVIATKNLPYTADISAGSGARYVASYMSISGVDTTQLENAGYELSSGRLPVKSGEVLVGSYTAYGFIDKYAPKGQNMRSADDYTCDENGICGQSTQVQDPFFDPLSVDFTIYTGANYQNADDYSKIGMASSSASSGSSGDTSNSGSTSGNSSQNSANLKIQVKPVGVLKASSNDGTAFAGGIVMTIDDMKALIAKATNTSEAVVSSKLVYDQVTVHAERLSDVANIEAKLKEAGYQTFSLNTIRESFEKRSRNSQLMLGGIGAVSFIVAAIGIANTMIMSVSERTREIGIMKALGCYVRDIRMMFLCEAGAIGLVGGIIGCAISIIASWCIDMVTMGDISINGLHAAIFGSETMSRTSVIPWWMPIAAIFFSIVVGVLAGFGPANKAVKIPALDAIKNDQ